jgi:hypothetical protein
MSVDRNTLHAQGVLKMSAIRTIGEARARISSLAIDRRK